MQYQALATDYDGTLACDSHVSDMTIAALRRLKASGRKLILVTGRELPELESVFPDFGLCDVIVAENGFQRRNGGVVFRAGPQRWLLGGDRR